MTTPGRSRPALEPALADANLAAMGPELGGTAVRLGSITAISRVTGLLRDQIAVAIFGAGALQDAWQAAFLLPNLLRRILAEGAMSIAFVPAFNELRVRGGDGAMRAMLARAHAWFGLLAAAVTGAAIAAAPWYVPVIFRGFSGPTMAAAVALTQRVFPIIFCLSLTALAAAVLHTHRSFTAPAVAPILLNTGIIAAVFVLPDFTSEPIYGLAYGAVAGAFAGLALQWVQLARHGLLRPPAFTWDPQLTVMFRLMVPALLSTSVYYINVFVARFLASHLPEGSISHLYLSDRLIELPLGIFAVAVATVALPQLSDHFEKGDARALLDTWTRSLRLSLFVSVAAAGGLAALASPVVEVIYQHGKFSAADTRGVVGVLYFALPGLLGAACVRVTVQLFYAIKQARQAVMAGTISLVLNALWGIALVGPLQAPGLALASSLAALSQFGLLAWALRRYFRAVGAWDAGTGARLVGAATRMVLAALAMAAVCAALQAGAAALPLRGFLWTAFVLAFCVVAGALAYFAACAAAGVTESGAVWARIKGKLGGRG